MLFHSPHLNLINKRKNPSRKFLTPSRDKEFSKLPVMLMLQLLKRNIINKLRTRRTLSELPEELWPTVDSFTIHQLLINMLRKKLLPSLLLKVKTKLKLYHTPLLHLTNRKLIPSRKFLTPSKDKEFSKLPVMLMLLLLKRNIINRLKTRRTLLELLEESKLTEDSYTIHQLLLSMLNQKKPNLSSKPKSQSQELHLNLTLKKLSH